MERYRDQLLLDVENILEDFFSESEYSTKVKENIRRMIFYMIPEQNSTSDTATPFVLTKCCKIINPNITEKELETARLLGCICQMLQTYHIALDDYVDDSDQRYGKLTWSKLHGHVKSVVVPDISVLRAIAFYALQKKFSHLPTIYPQILHLFLNSDILAAKGLCLEKHHVVNDVQDRNISMESFNMETYKLMFCLQGNVYLYLPLALAMTLSGFKKEEHEDLFRSLKIICDNYTVLIKLTDDYNEIFSSSDDYDSSDEDIRKGQLTWLFLMAKECCVSEDQVSILLRHYGKDNDKSVTYFKELLEKIGIHDLYEKYRKELTENMMKEMNSSFGQAEGVKEMFKWFFDFVKRFMRE